MATNVLLKEIVTKNLLKEIDNRLYLILKYYSVLDDKYKINVLNEINDKIKLIIEN